MYKLYTDGSCLNNSRSKKKDNHGAYAYVVVKDGSIMRSEAVNGFMGITSATMELKAIIEGLKWAYLNLDTTEIEVLTDSEMVVKGMTIWMKDWVRRDWKTTKGKPIANKELWFELIEIDSFMKVKFKHVRGHDGDIFNEVVHSLAYYKYKKYIVKK